MMKVSEFLDAIAAPKLGRQILLSTTKKTNPSPPKKYLDDLTKWHDIKEDIKNFLDPHLNTEAKELDPYAITLKEQAERNSWCSNERNLIRLGSYAYEEPTRVVLEACFNISGRFVDHGSACNLGDPDRVFATGPNSELPPKASFVMEWKTPWALETPDNLISEFKANRDDPKSKIAKAIFQIYGYMTWNSLKFGALCNYESLFLLRRTGDSGLQVSPPFRYSDKGSESIVAALTYICHYVTEVESFHHSPIEEGSKGSHILQVEDLDVDSSWDDERRVPWTDMNLHLMKSMGKNIAAVMSGEVRPRKGAKFRYSSTAIFKVYEVTTEEKLRAANKEIQAYEGLKALQGKFIPTLYAAGTAWDRLKILILGDCGHTARADNIDLDFWIGAEKAVRALHKAGVIHGDIKLDNFTISSSGVKLIDLGLCRQVNKAACRDELLEFNRLKEEWEKFGTGPREELESGLEE